MQIYGLAWCLHSGLYLSTHGGIWQEPLRQSLPRFFKYLCLHIHMYLCIFLFCFDLLRRVHISDKTLAFLNGEFEVEPAFGEKREELLRIAGLKTYFITKVVKPVSQVGRKQKFVFGLAAN